MAHALELNIKALAEIYGIERLGFLTLTFPEKIYSIKEASRRFDSLNTHLLSKRYLEFVSAVERGDKSRHVHFHLVIVLKDDIRTGINWDEVLDKNLPNKIRYRSGNRALKAEWAMWRKITRQRKYGFGRHELLPIRSTAEAVARYTGGYIGKHVGQRLKEDKGARLVRYSKGTNRACARFSWASPGQWLYRKKLEILAKAMGYTAENYAAKFREHLGANWIFQVGPVIESIRLKVYPSGLHIVKDYPHWGGDGVNLADLTECSMNGGRDHEPSVRAAVRTLFALYVRHKSVQTVAQGQGRGEKPLAVPEWPQEAWQAAGGGRAWADLSNPDP